ncbi:MAG: Prolipoprotein diacylglyceryl transferase [Acidimicrobiales bacterium]|nr:Prolipoprotein diacylglyceryl transferase [Acidimicrobiales bacterium]
MIAAAGRLVGAGLGHIVASIPSPSSGTLSIGPLKIHAYGLMIALGVVAGVWLLGRRLEQDGIGTRDDANSISVWAVIAGVIGSRLYHVATDWSKFAHHLTNIPKIWQGGLGIPGGLLFGIGTGAWMIRRKGIPIARGFDAAAPAIAIAQAIGRWGNYWNQELFGRSTKVPWGLEIDDAHLPEGFAHGTLFQTTFLYESLSNFALSAALIMVGRRTKLRPGHLMALYIMGYGVIRFFVEGLRIDEAHHVGGLRWNQWVALAAVVGGAVYLAVSNARAADVIEAETAAELEAEDEAIEQADAEDEAAVELEDAEVDDEEVEPEVDEPETEPDPANLDEDELPSSHD